MRKKNLARAAAASLLLLAPSLVRAAAPEQHEPWSDADPATGPRRFALGDFGLQGSVEYRANAATIRPISLNTEQNRNAAWIEHRLRTEGSVDYLEKVKLFVSADWLDGALWGDNGSLDPASDLSAVEPNYGANVAARSPNTASACVGLRAGGDPLDKNAYGYTLCPTRVVTIRRAYGELFTPIGVFRIGRMATIEGSGVLSNDGDGRTNRFGFARSGNFTDRILFGTKPLEGLKPANKRDLTPTGFIVAGFYDRVVTDSPQLYKDDLHQAGFALRYIKPKLGPFHDVFNNFFFAQRFDTGGITSLSSMGLRTMWKWRNLYWGFDGALITGYTREISEAYKTISNDPPDNQPILQGGFRAAVKYDPWKQLSLYFETDYASGSSDPRARATLSNFTWAEDSNVGLLMFKHALAFQTARAAAAGTELLTRLGATSHPSDAINTRGAFSNAVAIFPQIDVKPVKNVLLRGGVLMAWTSAPLIDPIQSLQRRRSPGDFFLTDDLVNFAGGKPGNFYGTELDFRAQWRFLEHFAADLEAAYLIPGNAFQNVDGYAVNSYLLQGRATFFF
jgi:hypothetical protein